jgi:hypothetical protein
MVVFPGSTADRARRSFCERFGLREAEDFYGFRILEAGFHYRYGNLSFVTGKKTRQKYARMTWKNPLGKRELRSKFQYILLHAPKTDAKDEEFYILKKRYLEKLIAENSVIENVINIPWHDASLPRDWRKEIMSEPVSAKHLVSKLRQLAKRDS